MAKVADACGADQLQPERIGGSHIVAEALAAIDPSDAVDPRHACTNDPVGREIGGPRPRSDAPRGRR